MGAVEVARRGEDAAAGQPGDALAAGPVLGGPQVERALRVVDAEAGPFEGGAHAGASGRVASALLVDVPLVAEGRDHGGLHRRRDDHAEVLAHGGELVDDRGVAGDEAGTVAGHVRALGQRLHGQQAGDVAVVDRRVEDRACRGVVGELGVALVRGEDRAVLLGEAHPAAQQFERGDGAVGVGGRVDPDEPRGAGDLVRIVAALGPGAGHEGAHLVGRVGDPGQDDGVAGAERQQRGQPADELLRADGGRHVVLAELDAAPATPQIGDDRLAQRRRAPHGRIAGGLGGGLEGLADDPGRGVDGRADGQVDDAPLVGAGQGPRPGQRVPREGGQRLREAHQAWGGSAATDGSSKSCLPRRAAPPGDPSSAKKFALMSSHWVMSSGRSSS